MTTPKLPDSLQVERIVSVPFDENTYIAWLSGREDCLIVDPGLQPQLILDTIAEHGLAPAAILNTHGHSDHIAGNRRMKQQWPEVPLMIGANDASKLANPMENLSGMFGMELTSPPADRLLHAGEIVSKAGFDLEVREIPGHSCGHVVFIQHSDPPVVFGGDVLFAGSIGNTEFPDGDFDLLTSQIREKLFDLPDETVVLPGHGPPTTIGVEKRTNPFVGEGR